MDSKKRPISPSKDLDDPKKFKTEQDEISFSTSPTLKTRTIKVIPPKSPLKVAEPSFKISLQQSADKALPIQKIVTMEDGRVVSEKVGLGLVQSTAKSPLKSSEMSMGKTKISPFDAKGVSISSPKKPQSPATKQKSPPKLGLKDINGISPKKNALTKTPVVDRAKKVAAILETMEFESPRSEVLALIQEAEKNRKGDSLIVNDARLVVSPSTKNIGHVIYTGAKSRLGNSNRAIDLDLFLCPAFTENDHFSTIEVRISAEFLTYRGNIAVRKSALWGTDIYTDDSDVVAMIIHSGHYRPVDAPDPFPENPDSLSVTQAALVKGDSGKQTTSSVTVKSVIHSQISPVIAHIDSAHSSITTLVPDHDLYVTLRVLPKLVKYTGSTRGWGSSHDGESVQVLKVEKAPSGSVSKQIKKTSHAKPLEAATPKSVVFSSLGQVLLKYTLDLVMSWPLHLKTAISTEKHKKAYAAGQNAIFKVSELEMMKEYPFWRLQLSKFKMILEGSDRRLILLKNEKTVKITDGQNRVVIEKISFDSIQFNETGLHIDHPSIDFPVGGLIWSAN